MGQVPAFMPSARGVEMRIVYWILSIPLAILIAIFAVSNRASVTLSLWPLPYEIDLPLFLPIMVALLIGLGIGLAYEWLVNGKHRRAAKRLDGELRHLRPDDSKGAVGDQRAIGQDQAS
ncbi:LapA family protein [Thalassospira alkalitolerans]|uniref:LapA family protein n=2 Tax=Thalassospira alkalitolerans TaxID=1293890 RepID=UPI003AA90651|tara:strand:+ start:2106 stop:2462 length:357 start_codon:yes stop_codon:yes gene_type:complete